MDTKWKNNWKLIIWVMLFIFGLNTVSSALYSAPNYVRDSYFKTSEFNNELNNYLEQVKRYDLTYLPKEEAKKQLTVTSDEINEHRNFYGSLNDQINNIKEQYSGQIQSAKDAGNMDVVKVYEAERDAKIKDITENFTSDEHVKAKILAQKEKEIDEQYSNLETERNDFLRGDHTFQYYFKDTATGEIHTNTNNLRKDNLLFSKDMNSFEAHGDQTGYFSGWVGVPKSAPLTSNTMINFNNYEHQQIKYMISTVLGLLALLTCLIMYKKKQVHLPDFPEKWRGLYDKIAIEIRLAVFIGTVFFLYDRLTSITFFNFTDMYSVQYLIDILISSFIWGTLFIIQFTWLKELLLNPEKLMTEIKAGVLPSVTEAVHTAFNNRKNGTKSLILLAIVFCFGAGSVFLFLSPFTALIYLIGFVVVGIPLFLSIVRKVGYFNKIQAASDAYVRGREYSLPVKNNTSLGIIAENLNTLKEGVQVSRKEQVKSERLKTELISNVSHDLRTPLTSIITYTDLLKNPNLTQEERDSYVEILDRKAKRLKVMIDDLFEASKMASGNIELDKEKVDLVQLLQQALAEYDEQIEASSLHFRVTQSNHPIFAQVDGRKMWRVFENLIGNILKYSLEHTRVYVSIVEEASEIKITFKNVSKFELGENTDELFERFKRGDTSRHTEGSGLGLAIAKSIVDLHGGKMDLELDGDLFKATITLLKN